MSERICLQCNQPAPELGACPVCGDDPRTPDESAPEMVYQILNGKADKYHKRESCPYIKQCATYREVERDKLPTSEPCKVCFPDP